MAPAWVSKKHSDCFRDLICTTFYFLCLCFPCQPKVPSFKTWRKQCPRLKACEKFLTRYAAKTNSRDDLMITLGWNEIFFEFRSQHLTRISYEAQGKLLPSVHNPIRRQKQRQFHWHLLNLFIWFHCQTLRFFGWVCFVPSLFGVLYKNGA